jgi:hypothetical protein
MRVSLVGSSEEEPPRETLDGRPEKGEVPRNRRLGWPPSSRCQ